MYDTHVRNVTFLVFRHGRGVPLAARSLAYYFEAPVGGAPRLTEARCLGFEPLREDELKGLSPPLTRHEEDVAKNLEAYVLIWRRLKLDDRVFQVRSSLLEGLFERCDHVGFGSSGSTSPEAELWQWVADGTGPGRTADELRRRFWSRFPTDRVRQGLDLLIKTGRLTFEPDVQHLTVMGPAFPPWFSFSSSASGSSSGSGAAGAGAAPVSASLSERYDPRKIQVEGVSLSKSYVVLVPTRESVSYSFWEAHRQARDQRVAFEYNAQTLLRPGKTRVAFGSPFTYEELLRLGQAAEGAVDYVLVLQTPDVSPRELVLAQAVARIGAIEARPLEEHCPALALLMPHNRISQQPQ